jgi:ribosomal peptide maturation radical SAM protein 1
VANKSIVLSCMPWLAPHQAPLGLGIVKRLLKEKGIVSRTHHANIDFFRRLSNRIGKKAATFAFDRSEVGEVVAGLVYQNDFFGVSDQAGLPSFLEANSFPRRLFNDLTTEFRSYVDQELEKPEFRGVCIWGFGLGIRQTMPSIYFASRLKAIDPRVVTVFGGSQCDDPMGLALFEAANCIDFLVRGEADNSIAPLFEALLQDRAAQLNDIPNIAYRGSGGEIVTTRSEIVDIRSAPAPDYTDFEEAYTHLPNGARRPVNYYLEASRGCWWGQKHHCVFCGIHTSGIAFREKSTEVVFSEVKELLSKHQTLRFAFADTILSTKHLKELIPQLEDLSRDFNIEFLLDIKPNISKQDLFALSRAGCICLQAGIESFSDRLLKLLNKGQTALKNIQLLKWCSESGVFPYYHVLTHVIDETPRDYQISLQQVKRIRHLPPPDDVFSIELNRYAPYFNNWRSLGFLAPRPAAFYNLMFPADFIDLDRFAYHFEGVHPSTFGDKLMEARTQLQEFVRDDWKPNYMHESLTYKVGDGFVEVERRGKAPSRIFLEGAKASVFLACDRIRGRDNLERSFTPKFSPSDISQAIDDLVDLEFVTLSEDGKQCLALAIRTLRLRPWLSTYSQEPTLL